MRQAGPLFIAVRGPFTVAASLVVGHGLQTRRLSSCGSRAQLLRGIWDPPRPGREPKSPALTGRLSTTAPPGKPQKKCILMAWNLNLRILSRLVVSKSFCASEWLRSRKQTNKQKIQTSVQTKEIQKQTNPQASLRPPKSEILGWRPGLILSK